jgi:uncharacterized protein (DUF58 family)
MIDIFLIFLVSTLAMAALARDRSIFSILYLFLGAYVLGNWWSRRALSSLKLERRFESYAFIGDRVPVELIIQNQSWLPLLWLRVQEMLSVEITRSGSYRRIVSCGPRERILLQYELEPRQRGYFPVGPMYAQTGDLLGMAGQRVTDLPVAHLIVFPKIIVFRKPKWPPGSPLGILHARQPVFEDPNRPIGKRNYRYGDSIRRIDWKSSASSGKLQVKQLEPSIDMQVMMYLNLNVDDYPTKFKSAAIELAITTAASIANWTIERKIETGIIINGFDAASPDKRIEPIAINKGRSQLVKILESLAKAKAGYLVPGGVLIQEDTMHLGWGTTLILITGQADSPLFEGLYRLRRKGVNVILVICGESGNYQDLASKSGYYGINVYNFINEKDLDIWR